MKIKEKVTQSDLIHSIPVSHFKTSNTPSETILLSIKIQMISLYLLIARTTTLCFSLPPEEIPEEDMHPGDSVGCSCCYNRTYHLGSCQQMRAFSSQSSTCTKDEVPSFLSSASSFSRPPHEGNHRDCLFLRFDYILKIL